MIVKSRSTLMAAAVFMVFALSTTWTAPVFADDSTPPPVDTPTEVAPPVDETVVVNTPDAEVVVPVDVTPPADDVSTEAVPTDATVTEVLAQVPEGTHVKVVDSNGESLPLATQEAADAVTSGDPIWCPLGIAPKANTGGCTNSYTSLAALITQLKTVTDPAKSGVIWIEGWNPVLSVGYKSSVNDSGVTSFTLDGDDFSNMDNFALSIRGGWSGLPLSTAINSSTPSVFSGASLSIVDWHGNISISDILVDSATSNTTNGGENSALLVETTGNIQLDRIRVANSINGSGMIGATLDNRASGIAGATVIVNNGTFDLNEGDGLNIFSGGVVTLSSIIADLNSVGGAVIDNTYNPSLTAPDKAVTLKGSQEFNNNGGGHGLQVISRGLITISNVVANSNSGNGVDLNNTTSHTNQGVTINGTNQFLDDAVGLKVLSHGVISANNISAANNGSEGAFLDNCYSGGGGGVGNCSTSAAKLVRLTGYNSFLRNLTDGLKIISFGAITVSNLTASDNGQNGAYLDNQRSSVVTAKESLGTITLTGYGIFNNNGADGLDVLSPNNISLANLTADRNVSNGVNIAANRVTPVVINLVTVSVANVTISGLNYFVENGDDGLLISADGKIALTNIYASFNKDDGADLTTTAFGSTVVVSGTNTFTQNTDAGLYISSSGAISASNVNSTYNEYGAQLLNNINTAKQYNITLSGTNSFNFNDAEGLVVHSYGVITVNNLTANENGLVTAVLNSGNGAFLDSCNYAGDYINSPIVCVTTTAKAVTLTGYANVSGNYFRGLQIYSLGAVTLSNITANSNGNVGLHINNQLNPSINKLVVRTVIIKGSNTFNYNQSTGLFIKSYGAISLNNIDAYGNLGQAGAALFNDITGAPTYTAKNITITGVNSFIKNNAYGLFFQSDGAVSLTRINADGNDPTNGGPVGGGLWGTAKTITLTCGHTFGNGKFDGTSGYHLAATGVLTIKGIYSAGNNNGTIPDVATGSTVIITPACALP